MLHHDLFVYVCVITHAQYAGVFSLIPIRDVTCCIMTHLYVCDYACTRAGVYPLIPIRDVTCCTMTHSYM